jgi:hypothetical protein
MLHPHNTAKNFQYVHPQHITAAFSTAAKSVFTRKLPSELIIHEHGAMHAAAAATASTTAAATANTTTAARVPGGSGAIVPARSGAILPGSSGALVIALSVGNSRHEAIQLQYHQQQRLHQQETISTIISTILATPSAATALSAKPSAAQLSSATPPATTTSDKLNPKSNSSTCCSQLLSGSTLDPRP